MSFLFNEINIVSVIVVIDNDVVEIDLVWYRVVSKGSLFGEMEIVFEVD